MVVLLALSAVSNVSNLKSYQPGQSGNPGGRTPTAWLRELLSAANDRSPEGKTRREAIFFHQLDIATRTGRGMDASPREATAAAGILNAYDMGKPVEALEVTTFGGAGEKTSEEMIREVQAMQDAAKTEEASKAPDASGPPATP